MTRRAISERSVGPAVLVVECGERVSEGDYQTAAGTATDPAGAP